MSDDYMDAHMRGGEPADPPANKENESLYGYEEMKKQLLTQEGVQLLINVRDKVRELLESAGAFKAYAAFVGSDSWLSLAALDWLKEEGEIVEVEQGPGTFKQNIVYVKGRG